MSDAPIPPGIRYHSLDLLRGIAVLAIFTVNIKGMAAPFAYYANASLWPGPHDMTIAGLQAFLIEDKWRTIFTALFGAGIILIAQKTDKNDAHPIHLLYRRLGWLCAFGLIHLILIWGGDILITYALAGFVATLFWRLSLKRLWYLCAIFLGLSYLWIGIFDSFLLIDNALRADVKSVMWTINPDIIPREVTTFLSSNVGDHIWERLLSAPEYILTYFLAGGRFVETLGIMLGGMALWKNGFLKAELTPQTYKKIAIAGLGLAIILDTGRWAALIISGWNFDIFVIGLYSNFFNGLAGGLGFAALIMLWAQPPSQSKQKSTSLIQKSFANAGKMAFTNYIACSLIGTTLFYGHGFSLFGELTLAELMGIVAITWMGLLLFSSLWLSFFRFGPLEWLWRSFTYGRAQPILRK